VSAGWLNPLARIESHDLPGGVRCVVVDQALREPERLVRWAVGASFKPANANAYPGLLADAPPELFHELRAYFDERVRKLLGGRRTLEGYARLSLVTLRPEQLRPTQMLCHRDPIALDSREGLIAAAVLYMFKDPALGGTAFYRPLVDQQTLQTLNRDQSELSTSVFCSRYRLQPGYMSDSNAYFERLADVAPVWNRLVFYDGGCFHSGLIGKPERLSADPSLGRLTLNAFFACRKPAI
jgi:Family of unknown function (DUF6445)